MKRLTAAAAIALSMSSFASENTNNRQVSTVDYSIIRSVGAVCGSGLSAGAKGELDAKILRIFGGISASGNARLDLGQVEELLKQIPDSDGKQAIYKTYVGCVTQVIRSIVSSSNESNTVPIIDNLFIPDPLIVIKDGQKFSMKVGDTRAIGRESLTFTVNRIEERGSGNRLVYYTVSEVGDGKASSFSKYNKQAQVIKLNTHCYVNPYSISGKGGNESVSFTTNCK